MIVRRKILEVRCCEICNAALEPRPTEKTWSFLRRRTCSPECAEQLRQRMLRCAVASAAPAPVIKKRKAYAPKTCPVCAAEFHPKPHETRTNYAKRVTCSPSCRAENIRRKRTVYELPASKICRCGTEFYRRPGERSSAWRMRLTCSRKCAWDRHKTVRGHCLQCGAELTTKGKYCSAKCANVHKFGDPDRLPEGFVERFAAHNGMTLEGASKLLGVAI